MMEKSRANNTTSKSLEMKWNNYRLTKIACIIIRENDKPFCILILKHSYKITV